MNKIMIVTGTRKGIGRYLSEAYLNEGYTVYGCSRRECDINHSHYHHAHLDVSDEQNVIDYVKHVYLREKRLDILVNNAGIGLMNHSVLTSTESAMRVMMTNYGGTFSFSRECAKYKIPMRIKILTNPIHSARFKKKNNITLNQISHLNEDIIHIKTEADMEHHAFLCSGGINKSRLNPL